MKDIPGYEIVEGECGDCDLIGKDCWKITSCDYKNIYKKKEEKTMTNDEIIEVIKAHKEGKSLQIMNDYKGWRSLAGNLSLVSILREIIEGSSLRIKPSQKVIPWMADDWREFKDECFKHKNHDKPGRMIVLSWNKKVIIVNRNGYTEWYTYEQVLNDFMDNGNPRGKVVEE